MLLTKSIIANSRIAASHVAERDMHRNAVNANEKMFGVNAGLIPQDVYQEFDNTTVTRFRSDDGDVFLNDLMARSRSINIGKLIHKFRRASDAGQAQVSMTGQTGFKMDNVDYSYDGSIVPIYDTSFGRNWREWAGQTSEGFDALIDDQRETVATLRRKMVDGFLDGTKDKDGNNIVVDGLSWGGMRNDARVNQIDLGAGGLNFDFTDTAQTGAAIKAKFIAMRDVLWITNNAEQDATYYISREIASNFERYFSTQYDGRTILQEMANLMGVGSIKVSSKLSGNEVMMLPGGDSVRPIVGMGINTIAMPRPVYNSDYQFVTWGAVGFEVRTDYAGNSGAAFAQ